jgi:lantibiotic biosynthesis protein
MSSPPDVLLRVAARLGARLAREAIWDGDRCAWMAPLPLEEGVQRATGPSLYEGTAGIALFLAELHRLTGEPVFRTAALGAATHAASRIPALGGPGRLSLHQGLPGVALALERAGHALDAEGLADAPRAALASARGERLEDEAGSLDVIGGAAGAISALLALGGDAEADVAASEGERLLDAAVPEEQGLSWRTIGDPAEPRLCGASHGASGIAAALLELGAATGEERFTRAGLDGFAFESARFDAERGTCPDLRRHVVEKQDGPAFGTTWCHGAAGAALTRLRAVELQPAPRLRQEAEAAVAACRRAAAAAQGDDGVSLCHGTSGLGEALLAGARVLGDAAAGDAAAALGLRVAARLAEGEAPRSGLPSGERSPGLMLGEAGLGHHLLRLCAPDRVAGILQVNEQERDDGRLQQAAA